ncbi:MAG: YidC/Oxa1 family membrane protein insertase [Solirubrobacterales bacterium]
MLPLANILQPIEDAANSVLTFFAEDMTLGFGIGIILLTFVTRIVILPLSVRQIKSMRALQAYSPQIKELNERYKDDPQRKQRELMAFYKDNQINPLASCFPLLLQLPVFFALFQLLRDERFKEEVLAYGDPGFLFIPDLTEKATDGVLIALIVIYFVSMVASMAISAAQAEGAQRVMLFALPVIFTPFIISFPAGLILYWITTNVWTIGQQYAVKAFWPAPPVATVEEVKATRPPPPPPRKKKKRR